MLVINSLLHQNIFIRRNNNFILDIQYAPEGVVLNTSNITRVYMQIRPYKNANTMFLQLSNFDQVIKLSGSDGGIHINIPYTTTRDLPKFDKAYYDIIIFTSGNIARTIMEGQIEIEKSVARIYDGPVGDSSSTGNNNLNNGYIPVWDDILEKPNFSKVAVTGSYNDLLNSPQLFDGKYSSLVEKPQLSNVALTGSYKDLKDKPTMTTEYSYNDLKDKPNPVIYAGNWTSTVAYLPNNVVYYQNSSYICIIANKGVDPITNMNVGNLKVWQILVTTPENPAIYGGDF